MGRLSVNDAPNNRVLVVVCDSSELEHASAEVTMLVEQMQKHVKADVWWGATVLQVQQTRQRYEVIHLIGHGDGELDGRRTFVFVDEQGQFNAVKPETLAAAMKGDRMVFVLMGCDTYGLGLQLFNMGHTAVSFRTPLLDEAAPHFSGAFYKRLADFLGAFTDDAVRCAFDAAVGALQVRNSYGRSGGHHPGRHGQCPVRHAPIPCCLSRQRKERR